MRLASIAPSTTLPRTGLSLLRAYATPTSTSRQMIQPPTAYSTVLVKYLVMRMFVHAVAYVSGCQDSGTRVGVLWAYSAGDFTALVTIQYRSEERRVGK